MKKEENKIKQEAQTSSKNELKQDKKIKHPKYENKHKKELDQFKKDLESFQTKSFNLEIENFKLKSEIENQNKQFAQKAKTFASKAQEELQKLKKENNEKLEKEIVEVKKYGTQKFFENFLIPFGNLELAIKAGLNQDNVAVNNYVRGFEMLANQIDNLMNDFGIEKITPQIGEEYSPEVHQVFEVTKQEDAKANSIVQIKSNGYKLYDRVIKPAIVVIAK